MEKPRPDYPLWWRKDSRIAAGGSWCREIDRKKISFGPDPEDAEQRYNDHLDAIARGVDPSLAWCNVTLADVYSGFVDVQHARAKQKKIQPRSFKDLRRSLDHFCTFIGPLTLVAELRVQRFTDYWHKLSAKFGVEQVNKRVNFVRKMFEFAAENELIEHPMKFGPVFKAAGRDEMDKLRASQRKKRKPYLPKQVRQLIKHASQPLKTQILLGINCMFGPTDIGYLPLEDVHLRIERDAAGKVIKAGGWHTFPRQKNKAVERRCFFFPETALAFEEWLAIRAKMIAKMPARKKEWDDLVFLTLHRRPYVRQTVHEVDGAIETVNDIDTLNPEFSKLCKKLELPSGFYRIRHTGITWLDQVNDPTVEARIRGHKLPGMKRVYVHKVEGKRLRKAVRELRRKLYPIKKQSEAPISKAVGSEAAGDSSRSMTAADAA